MREQLIQLVQEKTGLSAPLAGQAVDTVLQFLKGQLPEPLGAQLEAVLGGKAGGKDGADLGAILGGLGGLLGGGK